MSGQLVPCDMGKGQWILLADVFVIGPLMVWGGLELRRRSRVAGYGLIAMGVGTVVLNGVNYLRFARSHDAVA